MLQRSERRRSVLHRKGDVTVTNRVAAVFENAAKIGQLVLSLMSLDGSVQSVDHVENRMSTVGILVRRCQTASVFNLQNRPENERLVFRTETCRFSSAFVQ